ncbi:MAG: domain S-box protein, partial [Marmoricola sp.]|nr:domain S-box protein [Marmoricola sp.]
MLSIGAKTLQEEVDRWRALINTLPALVALWGEDQRNVMGNAAYEEWFGLPPAELRGMHLREVLGAGLHTQNLPHVEAVLRGEPQTFDRTVVTASGETRHTQAVYLPHVVEGDVQGFYAMVTDVTGKVEAQRDLLAAQALARIGSYTVAPATQTLRLSLELRRMLGFPSEG